MTDRAIFTQLQKQILSSSGLRAGLKNKRLDLALGPIVSALPGHSFPCGAIHEWMYNQPEDHAASTGFVSAILSKLLIPGATVIWIGSRLRVFPPALKIFGIDPGKIIFIDIKKQADLLWTMEEALRCKELGAVIGELGELSFTASRRLQLAVEQSRVTGFLLRDLSRSLPVTASVARWKITSLPGELPGALPGVGFPRWKVELLRARNGKAGNWTVEWTNGNFRYINKLIDTVEVAAGKTG